MKSSLSCRNGEQRKHLGDPSGGHAASYLFKVNKLKMSAQD